MASPHHPSPPVIVKICGLTRLEDAAAALEAGADWLGWIRWPRSPRYRPLPEVAEQLAALRARAPRPFEAVGVYVNAPLETILDENAAAHWDRVQLHGDEPPDAAARLARALGLPIIKSFPIADADSLALADRYPQCDLLADAADPQRRGGTGQPYDYRLLRPLAARRRLIVAGGLTPETVAAVIRLVRPWGVDVSSAVERAPGIKDHEQVRRFLDAARSVQGGS